MLLCNSEEPFKERFQFINDGLLLRGTVSDAEAGNGRHQFINVRAGGFDFAVTERIFNKAAGLFFLEVFGLDDINELHILKNHCFHNEYHLDKGLI